MEWSEKKLVDFTKISYHCRTKLPNHNELVRIMLKATDIERIEAYLKGQLDEKAKQKMEEKIHSSPSFAAEVEAYRPLIEGFNALELEHFEEQMAQWERKHQQGGALKVVGKAQSKSNRRWLSIAAAIALLLIPAGILLFNNADQAGAAVANNELEAFEQYFEPTPYQLVSRTAISPDEDEEKARLEAILNNAISAYNAKEYSTAIDLFSAYVAEKPESMHINFFLGVSYLAENQIDPAKAIFNELIKHKHNMYHDQAEWYLALAELKSENLKQAMRLLRRMKRKDAHYCNKEATELYEKLQAIR